MSGFTKKQIDFMRQACLMCDNSSLDVKTGCVLVKDGNIIGEGWNIDAAHHAEFMAVNTAKESKKELNKTTIFVSRFPCLNCAQMLVEEGIDRIFYMSNHFSSNNEALPFLESSEVIVKQIPPEIVWSSEK
jgi:deoxycytidylate deaminase